MSNASLTEINQNILKKEFNNLCWKDSLAIRHLLDTVSSILAEEYIMIAKQNPGCFLTTEVQNESRNIRPVLFREPE